MLDKFFGLMRVIVMLRTFFAFFLTITALAAESFELSVQQVTDNGYAIIGDIGPRNAENHALNNTLGFIVTPEGVVLVGSGATPAGAALIEKAVARVTNQPIRHVINLGVQDHHWLGNGYFAAKGIPITALKRTVDGQRKHVDAHLSRLAIQVVEEVDTILPNYADQIITGDQYIFTVGGVAFTLLWPGDGHFVGDAVLWMPTSKTLFTGDFVFHDRLLGIHAPASFTQWHESFTKIVQLNPSHIIPGHGYPGDLAKAQRDTGHYLAWLQHHVENALSEWQELDETIERLSDAPQFAHLKFFEQWHRRNIHQAYIQLEVGQ